MSNKRSSSPLLFTTFSMKKNSVAVEKWFLFIQNIFSCHCSHLARACHCIGYINIGYRLIRLYRCIYIGNSRYKCADITVLNIVFISADILKNGCIFGWEKIENSLYKCTVKADINVSDRMTPSRIFWLLKIGSPYFFHIYSL